MSSGAAWATYSNTPSQRKQEEGEEEGKEKGGKEEAEGEEKQRMEGISTSTALPPPLRFPHTRNVDTHHYYPHAYSVLEITPNTRACWVGKHSTS